jgi:hypothetical protein
MDVVDHYEHFVPVEDKAAMSPLEAEVHMEDEVHLVREFKEDAEVEHQICS